MAFCCGLYRNGMAGVCIYPEDSNENEFLPLGDWYLGISQESRHHAGILAGSG